MSRYTRAYTDSRAYTDARAYTDSRVGIRAGSIWVVGIPAHVGIRARIPTTQNLAAWPQILSHSIGIRAAYTDTRACRITARVGIRAGIPWVVGIRAGIPWVVGIRAGVDFRDILFPLVLSY